MYCGFRQRPGDVRVNMKHCLRDIDRANEELWDNHVPVRFWSQHYAGMEHETRSKKPVNTRLIYSAAKKAPTEMQNYLKVYN